MSTRRTDRPFVRQPRRVHHARNDRATSLAALAGTDAARGVVPPAPLARPTVEHLEARQLLFSLTIGPDDVNPDTGLGTIRQTFGYAIPLLQTTADVETNEIEVATENFDEEALGAVGTGRIFGEEGLVVFHNILQPNANFRMIADVDAQGQLIDGTERIRANPNVGSSFRFRFLEDPTQGPNSDRLAVYNFAIRFAAAAGTNQGITPSSMRVQLLLDGEVLEEYVGNEIQQFKVGNQNNGIGTYTFSTGTGPNLRAFDEIAFITSAGPNPGFEIDDISWSLPAGNFTGIVLSRVYGAVLTFTGPVGSSVTVLDLYGRDMRPTIRVGQIGASSIAFIDVGDDGTPDFNDGIGQIIMAGTDSRARLSIIGGEINQGYDADAIFNEGPLGGGFNFPPPLNDAGYYNLRLPNAIFGFADEWEEAGFGFVANPEDGGTGFSEVVGSVIIGSPLFRSLTNYNAQGFPTGPGSFNPITPGASTNPNQGIFVLDGSSMGDVSIHGLLFGSSRFEGALESLGVSSLYGSVSVEGDLGGLYVQGDAGFWVQDPDFPNSGNFPFDPATSTGAELIVGRTLRDFWVGARNSLDVTVVGDVANPQNRPPLDHFNYIEREQIFGVNEAAQYDVIDWLSDAFIFRAPNLPRNPILLGADSYRNDQLPFAEFLGTTGTAVQVSGSVGLGDPAVDTNEDPGDVYAFATDGRTPVSIELEAAADLVVRVLDGSGNTLSALGLTYAGSFQRDQRIVFTPQAPGVYYLAFQRPALTEGSFAPQGGQEFYSFLISGIAPSYFGSYFTGAGTGVFNTNVGPSINLLAGDLGFVRTGVSTLTGSGQITDPTELTNTTQTVLDTIVTGFMALSVADGNLYTFMSGGDIEGAGNPLQLTSIFVSGDLGSFITGQNIGVGLSPESGDVGFLSIQVGGRVGVLDIRGSIGRDIDDGGVTGNLDLGIFRFRSGVSGGSGDIGLIRVGGDIDASVTSFQTSSGSTIGALLVSQDIAPRAEGDYGIYGPVPIGGIFATGVGSDIRFADFPAIDSPGGLNVSTAIVVGTPIEIIDDGGATVRITVTGAGGGTVAGAIRYLPVDGSEGVALAQIDALDLTGRDLLIETIGSPSDAPVSIGRINLVGADAATNITFSGPVELDVWRIIQTGGEAFDTIFNETPGGDFVAIDVVGLNRIDLTTGNLGRTQTLAWGPALYGPLLGVASGLQGTVGAALGINPAAINGVWNDTAFRPVTDVTNLPVFLDDLGGPFDGYLDGVVIRTGNVVQIRVGGSVGDVILQGGGAVLTELVVNTDNSTPRGEFHGILGSIYAPNINRVEVGDGIRAERNAPLGGGGIFAENQIIEITAGTAARPASIQGRIWAANLLFDANPVGTDVIGRIFVNGGDYIDASIGGGLLDGFWTSTIGEDTRFWSGNVGRVTGQGADFFRSEVSAFNMTELNLNGGFFDASTLLVRNRMGDIAAEGYRNSTLSGTAFEFLPTQILISENLGSLRTQTATGSVRDTLVDVIGSVTQNITAGFIIRSNIQVDNEIPQLIVSNSIRGSQLTFGRLEVATVTRSIRHSEIRGNQILSVTAGDSITNTRFVISGPGGRLDVVTALNNIQGEFIASAPIGAVTSTLGDIDASITTTTRRGTVGTLTAGRDLILDADISRGLSGLVAGRHIGEREDPTVILVRGNLTAATAPNGQLYSDIRVGQNITGTVTLGAAPALPANDQTGQGSLVAFGSIASVIINGDFGGSIISYTGGIASIAINNGSFLRGDTARPNTIAAYDGDITSLVITGGNLYGDVYADYDLVSLQVLPTADGVFGDIGVNPAFNANQAYDARRNRVPVGVAPSSAVQGPRIAAGRNIIAVAVTGGSVFETGFSAGRAIQSITIAQSLLNDSATAGRGSYFVAGDTISGITIGGDASAATFLAGGLDLGLDQRPEGTGNNADTVQSGSITGVTIAGNASNILALAGVQAGADGVYGNSDDTTALGISGITGFSIGGTASGVVLRSDVVSSLSKDGVSTNGGGLPTDDALTAPNNPAGTAFTGSFSFNLGSGERGTFTLAGAGTAVWHAGSRTLSLLNTDLTSSLTVTSTGSKSTLTDLVIATNDDASLGALTINAELAGASSVVVDGDGSSFRASALNTTGRIRYGGDLSSFLVTGNFLRGHFEAKDVATAAVRGSFGDPNLSLRNEASITITNLGAIDIDGQDRGVIVVAREANTINVDGAISNALIRVGSRLGALTAGSLLRTRVSVGDFLGGASASSGNTGGNQNVQAVRILGDMFDSAIMVGGDLGADGEIGGSGLNADRVTSGFLGSVFVGGDFEESDITAGTLRGSDGFFGTADDLVAAGRSTIGNVTIVGSGVGSNRFTEAYAIASTGSIGSISIGGQTGRPQLNFDIQALEFQPIDIQVVESTVEFLSGRFVASLTFSQPLDAATIDAALSIREFRNAGAVQLFLISGEDYDLQYNAATSTAVVTFNRAVTEANLPIIAGRPAPGLFNFVLDADTLRGSLSSARLDGDADGFARGDDYAIAEIIGDAGDKLTPGTGIVTAGGSIVHTVDFYGPVNLDVLFDRGVVRDSLPDTNTAVTIRGFIGDHADQNVNYFRFGSDVDIYQITLQAGQILRLGAMGGSAQQAVRAILDSSGNALFAQGVVLPIFTGGGGSDGPLASLLEPTNFDELSTSFSGAFYVRQGGTYYISVGQAVNVTNPAVVSNFGAQPSGLGSYSFTVEVFDDLDSGFNGPTDAGDGTNVVDAPAPSAFQSPDSVIVINDYTFRLSTDPLGNQVVIGTSTQGVTSTWANGVLTSTIQSAIGPAGVAGVPNTVYGDLDVYHLSNGALIANGSRYRVTLSLSEIGGNLGTSVSDRDFFTINLRSLVQLAIFDTTNATDATDATLYLAPSQITGIGGEPNTILGDNGTTVYGFDENGDFFMEFVLVGRAGADGVSGTSDDLRSSYAVYVQGTFNTDYSLTIQTAGTGQITKQTQNIFLETQGGEVNWLEAGGLVTNLLGFDLDFLGFEGTTSTGVGVQQFVLQRIVSTLQNAFETLGLDVNISTDPNDFEFEPFSTIFLTNSLDPINLTVGTEFGYSQRSDPLNTDIEDEAVVFLSSFATLSFTPDQTGLTALADALTAAVGRRAGELMGLRVTEDQAAFGSSFDIMSGNSPNRGVYPSASGASWQFLQSVRSLSSLTNPGVGPLVPTTEDSYSQTNFIIGVQSSASLLERVLARN